MRSHQALPKLAMIGYEKMKQFVHNDIIGDFVVNREELTVEVKITSSGARCPFGAHRTNRKRMDFDIQLRCPPQNTLLESSLRFFRIHIEPFVCSTVKRDSTIRVTFSKSS